MVSAEDRARLDRLLVVEEGIGLTPLTWYRTGATSYSAGAMLKVLEKIAELRATGLAERDLSALNPNRLKLLARMGGKATNQALARLAPERRYPILLAFLHQMLTVLTKPWIYTTAAWEMRTHGLGASWMNSERVSPRLPTKRSVCCKPSDAL